MIATGERLKLQTDFQRIEASAVEAKLCGESGQLACDTDRLQLSFDSLVPDPYMPAECGIRKRRFGRFQSMRDGEFASLPGKVFVQSTEINRVSGGIRRQFAPLEDDIRNSNSLRCLIQFLAGLIDGSTHDWLVNVHQFRVETNGAPASAAPEGVHRDGHDFIAIISVRRQNIEGGINSIYGEHKELLLTTLLSNPFDTLLINDRTTFHDVTPIQPAAGKGAGLRDTLILDFNRLRSDS